MAKHPNYLPMLCLKPCRKVLDLTFERIRKVVARADGVVEVNRDWIDLSTKLATKLTTKFGSCDEVYLNRNPSNPAPTITVHC